MGLGPHRHCDDLPGEEPTSRRRDDRESACALAFSFPLSPTTTAGSVLVWPAYPLLPSGVFAGSGRGRRAKVGGARQRQECRQLAVTTIVASG